MRRMSDAGINGCSVSWSGTTEFSLRRKSSRSTRIFNLTNFASPKQSFTNDYYWPDTCRLSVENQGLLPLHSSRS